MLAVLPGDLQKLEWLAKLKKAELRKLSTDKDLQRLGRDEVIEAVKDVLKIESKPKTFTLDAAKKAWQMYRQNALPNLLHLPIEDRDEFVEDLKASLAKFEKQIREEDEDIDMDGDEDQGAGAAADLGQQHLLLLVIELALIRLSERFQEFPVEVLLVLLLGMRGQLGRSVDGVVLGGPFQHVVFTGPASDVSSRAAEDAVVGTLERVDGARRGKSDVLGGAALLLGTVDLVPCLLVLERGTIIDDAGQVVPEVAKWLAAFVFATADVQQVDPWIWVRWVGFQASPAPSM